MILDYDSKVFMYVGEILDDRHIYDLVKQDGCKMIRELKGQSISMETYERDIRKVINRRKTNKTSNIENSSRGHLIMTLHFNTKGSKKPHFSKIGSVRFIDVCGSETFYRSANDSQSIQLSFLNTSNSSLHRYFEDICCKNHVPKETFLTKSLSGLLKSRM